MTNGWVDIKNTDMMLIMGGNPAENHPCGFKWAIEAKLHRNAKLISVDPRFTRTSANADLFCQIRAGTDIAFLGGVIKYAIDNGRYAHDYIVNFTNASFIVKDGFKLPEDGLYSGFDPDDEALRPVDRGTTRRTGREGRERQEGQESRASRRETPGRFPRRCRPTSRTTRRCSIRAACFSC